MYKVSRTVRVKSFLDFLRNCSCVAGSFIQAFCPVQLLTDVKHHTTNSHMEWVGIGRGDGKLRDMPVDGDAPDLIAVVLAESQCAIRSL